MNINAQHQIGPEFSLDNEAHLEEIKMKLIGLALNKYQVIYPCRSKSTIDECFSIHNDSLVLWFNTPDHNTHIVSHPISKAINNFGLTSE